MREEEDVVVWLALPIALTDGRALAVPLLAEQIGAVLPPVGRQLDDETSPALLLLGLPSWWRSRRSAHRHMETTTHRVTQ